MVRTGDQIISASRRTDIPGGYTDWFMERIRQETFVIKNPYTGKKRTLSVRPDNTHSIVFWSKNYGPFLEKNADRILTDQGFHLYFNFTINSENSLLEPGLPSLEARLTQLTRISRQYGPDKIAWRFDPICFYRKGEGRMENNLTDFSRIAETAAELGIPKCVTSFYDAYAKVKKRTAHRIFRGEPGIVFTDPGHEKKHRVIERMAAVLGPRKIRLCLCCESELFRKFSKRSGIPPDFCWEENACIDGPLLKKLFGGNPELTRDSGQRTPQGCRCTKSVDIGSYEDHPCFHDCLFCYANTVMDTRIKKNQ